MLSRVIPTTPANPWMGNTRSIPNILPTFYIVNQWQQFWQQRQ